MEPEPEKTVLEVLEAAVNDSVDKVGGPYFESYLDRLEYYKDYVSGLEEVEITRENVDKVVAFLDSLAYFPKRLKDAYKSLLEYNQDDFAGGQQGVTESTDAAAAAADTRSAYSAAMGGVGTSTERNESVSPSIEELLEQFKGPENDAIVAQIIEHFRQKDATISRQDATLSRLNATRSRLNATRSRQIATYDIYKAYYKMTDEVRNVHVKLNSLASYVQETKPENDTTENNSEVMKAFLKKNERSQGGYRAGRLVSITDWAEEGRSFTNRAYREQISEWTVEKFESLDAEDLADERKEWLQKVAFAYNDHMSSKVVKPKKSAQQKKLRKAINQNLNVRLKDVTAQKDTSGCPPMCAYEIEGHQPTFEGLIDAIVNRYGYDTGADLSDSTDFSPSKKKSESKKKPRGAYFAKDGEVLAPREVDMIITKPGLHQLRMMNLALQTTCEIKPLFRQDSTPDHLDVEYSRQVISHLAKWIMQCLNFQATGTSSHATGVICTLAYIKVVQLHLIMVEGAVKLVNSQSKRLPLLSKQSFVTWKENQTQEWKSQIQNQRALDEIEKSLYGPNGDEGSSKGIPKGILALHALATERPRCFFGPDYNALFKIIDETNEVVVSELKEPKCMIEGDVLGKGGYGVVIDAKYGSKECVMKAPTLSLFWHHIRHEGRVLTELCKDARAPNYMSQLEKELNLRVELGSALNKVPALLLSPRGIPLLHFLQSRQLQDHNTTTQDCAATTWDQGGEALRFVHENGFLHNDVTPKNIIIASLSPFSLRLVDFGSACKLNERPDYFCCTTLFAHDDALWAYPKGCRPQVKHDFFGLVLSCCAIAIFGVPSWSMQGFPDEETCLEDVLVARYDAVNSIIDTQFTDQRYKKCVREWKSYLK